MVYSKGDLYNQRTAWSLLYFLNYVYYDTKPSRKFWWPVSKFSPINARSLNDWLKTIHSDCFFLLFFFFYLLLTQLWGCQKNQETLHISMISLLMHTVAHSTRPSFRLKINSQPIKKVFKSCVQLSKSSQKWQNSDFQSQFSMSKITVKSRVLTCVTNKKINFLSRSQYIRTENPLHKQSEKACMCF